MPIVTTSRPFSVSRIRQTRTLSYNWVSLNGTQSTYNSQTIGSFSGTNSRSRSGADNPKWLWQVRNHQNATTGLIATEERYEYGSGSSFSMRVTRLGQIETITTVTETGPLPCAPVQVGINPTTLTQALDDAKAKLYKKLYEIQTPFQGGVFLGELRETLHMIKHPADGLAKLILGEQFLSTKAKLKRASLRKKRPLKGDQLKRSLKKAAADTWLENAFGWQPFISDIESGLKLYNEQNSMLDFIPFRVTGKASAPANVALITDWTTGFVGYKTIETRTHEARVYVYGHAFHSSQGVNAKLGLTWGNFVPTAWELLPFSFLADYFSNIGDVLSSTTVDLGSVKWISHTRVNSGVNTVTFQDFRSVAGAGPLTQTASGSSEPVVRRKREVSRFDVFDYTSPPTLKFEFPFKPKKWYNMGALITSVWSGASPPRRVR